MRIAGGTLRGRVLKTPPSDFLRPTQDAVREAVFSMLAAVLPGSCFLDLFAGTGAVGLEAFSRGAQSVIWVEKSPKSLRLLRENLQTLCPGAPDQSLRIVPADVAAWLRHPALPAHSVSIVYLDPPYVTQEGADDGMSAYLSQLAASGILQSRAFVVVEQRDRTPLPAAQCFELVSSRRYGRTLVSIFRYTEQAAPQEVPAGEPVVPMLTPQPASFSLS